MLNFVFKLFPGVLRFKLSQYEEIIALKQRSVTAKTADFLWCTMCFKQVFYLFMVTLVLGN